MKTRPSSPVPPYALLNRSIVSLGDHSSIAPLLHRLRHSKPITIVGIGSSISARSGGCTHSLLRKGVEGCCAATCTSHSSGWLRYFFDALNASYPHPRHRLFNAAIPASAPSSFTECFNDWLPADVDLYILEFVAVKGIRELATRLLVRKRRTEQGGMLVDPRRPTLLFVGFRRWVQPMDYAHARLMQTAAALGMPAVSQLEALSKWRGKSWPELLREAASCAKRHTQQASGGGRRLAHQSGQAAASPRVARVGQRRETVEMGCWGPAAQVPDGLHPTTHVGQAFMGAALAFWLRRASDAFKGRVRASRQHISAADGSANAIDNSTSAAPYGVAQARLPAGTVVRMSHRCFAFDARRLGDPSIFGEAILATAVAAGVPGSAALHASETSADQHDGLIQRALLREQRHLFHHLGQWTPPAPQADLLLTSSAHTKSVGAAMRAPRLSTRFERPSRATAAIGPDGGLAPMIVARRGFEYVLDFRAATVAPRVVTEPREDIHAQLAAITTWHRSLPVREAKAGLAARCPTDFVELDVGGVFNVSSRTRTQSATPQSLQPYVALDYLTSYSHMGQALLTCTGGCTCEPSLVDAHEPQDRTSVRALHYVAVSTLSKCRVRIEIANTTSSGGHRFKLIRFVTGTAFTMTGPPSQPGDARHTGDSTQLSLASPPPPPMCRSSGLRGDREGPVRCEPFCRAANAPRHCLLCKCTACPFCQRPLNASQHRMKDIMAALAAAKEAPPPSPPLPPPPVAVPSLHPPTKGGHSEVPSFIEHQCGARQLPLI